MHVCMHVRVRVPMLLQSRRPRRLHGSGCMAWAMADRGSARMLGEEAGACSRPAARCWRSRAGGGVAAAAAVNRGRADGRRPPTEAEVEAPARSAKRTWPSGPRRSSAQATSKAADRGAARASSPTARHWFPGQGRDPAPSVAIGREPPSAATGAAGAVAAVTGDTATHRRSSFYGPLVGASGEGVRRSARSSWAPSLYTCAAAGAVGAAGGSSGDSARAVAPPAPAAESRQVRRSFYEGRLVAPASAARLPISTAAIGNGPSGSRVPKQSAEAAPPAGASGCGAPSAPAEPERSEGCADADRPPTNLGPEAASPHAGPSQEPVSAVEATPASPPADAADPNCAVSDVCSTASCSENAANTTAVTAAATSLGSSQADELLRPPAVLDWYRCYKNRRWVDSLEDSDFDELEIVASNWLAKCAAESRSTGVRGIDVVSVDASTMCSDSPKVGGANTPEAEDAVASASTSAWPIAVASRGGSRASSSSRLVWKPKSQASACACSDVAPSQSQAPGKRRGRRR